MSMVIPPNHRQGELGVISPLELDKTQCRDIIELHKDPQNVHKTARINAENSNVVDLKTRDTDVWVIHEDHHWVDALICTPTIKIPRALFKSIGSLWTPTQNFRDRNRV